MEGQPSEVKLGILKQYYDEHCIWIDKGTKRIELPPRNIQVQVDNYINALRRGGILDTNLNVKREI